MASHAVSAVRRRRRRAGFTLIEVMISVLLSVIATVGIIALYTVETRASAFTRRTSEATVLAQDQLERLRTQVTPVAAVENNLDALGNIGAGPYTRTSVVALDGTSSYWTTTVTVSWINEENLTKSVIVRGRRSN